jgi:AP-1-like factor
MGSLDELFGMNVPAMDFTQSPPAAPSLAHTSSASSSSSSSPNFANYGGVGHSPTSLMSSPASTDLSSPPSSTGSPAVEHQQHGASCPRTKAEFAARIASEMTSPFTTTSPSASAAPSPSANGTPSAAIKKTHDTVSGGAQITCAGSVFPQTEKSPMNIEVLAAWRDITSDPKFKDVDINELCAEFTNKAKCDGTKVVLDRQGVEEIKNNTLRSLQHYLAPQF